MMRLLRVLLLVGLIAVVTLVPSQAVRAGTSFDDVASELMCQCGCRLTLTACNMPECTVRQQMAEQIKTMLSQGQSKDEIINYFVSTYGEEALAAPTKKGFNLTAWLMPFAALAAGVGFVYLVVDQWVLRKGRSSQEEDDAVDEEISPAEVSEYEKRLKKELEQYEGAE